MLTLHINCLDIDECTEGLDDCDVNAMCFDLPGGFECGCLEGFTGNGRTCSGKYWGLQNLCTKKQNPKSVKCSLFGISNGLKIILWSRTQ